MLLSYGTRVQYRGVQYLPGMLFSGTMMYGSCPFSKPFFLPFQKSEPTREKCDCLLNREDVIRQTHMAIFFKLQLHSSKYASLKFRLDNNQRISNRNPSTWIMLHSCKQFDNGKTVYNLCFIEKFLILWKMKEKVYLCTLYIHEGILSEYLFCTWLIFYPILFFVHFIDFVNFWTKIYIFKNYK